MKRRERWPRTPWVWPILGVLILGGSIAVGRNDAPGSPEAREVMEALARQAARVESLDVSYRPSAKTGPSPEQRLALSAFRNQLHLPDERNREAFAGARRCKQQVQPRRVEYLGEPDALGAVRPAAARPGDPEAIRKNQEALKRGYDRTVAVIKAQEAAGLKAAPRVATERPLSGREVTRATNGRSPWMRHPLTERADESQTRPVDSQAQWFGRSASQSAVGLQAPDPTAKSSDAAPAPFRPARWVKDRAYALEAEAEVIDGSSCLVLKGDDRVKVEESTTKAGSPGGRGGRAGPTARSRAGGA